MAVCSVTPMKTGNKEQEKILMMMLPFWTPLIPPMGICSLKSYLEKYGYCVKTIDGNTQPELWEINHRYFDTLKGYIPESNWGNFYNIGYNVFRNHLMAYINREDEAQYTGLVKDLIYKHYYWNVSDNEIKSLDDILQVFYSRLEDFLIGQVERENPSIVGISVFSGSFAPALFAFKLIKEKYPHIKTVMGGGIFSDQLPINSPDFEFFLESSPFIDKVMVGQGENLWLRYLQGQLPEEQRVYSLKDINWEIADFASVQIPDFSDISLDYYPYLGATGSSSCPFECSFCNVAAFWGKYRKKGTSQTISEMTKMHEKSGVQLFFMTDSLLNPIIHDLSNEFIRSGISLYWDGYLRVDKAVSDIENTMLWRKGGFYRARIGVESGSQHVLDLMGKKITPEQTKASISALAYAGIKTTAYFVIGHPGETEEDFQQTLDMLEELKNDIWEAELNPFTFFYTGQSNSDEWAGKRMLLYPEESRRLLISQTWNLDCEPSREEVYRRVFRFTEHCKKLGIPNPYTMQELYEADERWKRLHKNAVPSVVEFRSGYIDENKHIGKPALVKNDREFDEFCF